MREPPNNLLKPPRVRREGDVLLKIGNPEELRVEKEVLNYFKNFNGFRVPKVVDSGKETELIIEYIPGITLTKFFYLLDSMGSQETISSNDKQSLLRLKSELVDEMARDLGFFQSHNVGLTSLLGKSIGKYPYRAKLLESIDSLANCEDSHLSSSSYEVARGDLSVLADFLYKNSQFLFRDSTTNNVLLNYKGVEGLSSEEIMETLLKKLRGRNGLRDFENTLCHIDFATSNRLVTGADDFVHIFEHRACSLEESVGESIPLERDEIYYATMAGRMLRFFARERATMQFACEGKEQYLAQQKFYFDKTLFSLGWLERNSSQPYKGLSDFLLGADFF